MPAQLIYEIFFATFAFLLGACVGSFLNVCIYRLPLNMSVDEPKRSFCPLCKYQIPWTSNLPLITWTVQRGKCKNCKAPIPFRYFGVEFLTALMFLAVWFQLSYRSGAQFPGHWILIFPMFTFVSLLIVATFIDFEHFIIPDGVTIGGTIAGLVFSAGLPWMHGETTNLYLREMTPEVNLANIFSTSDPSGRTGLSSFILQCPISPEVSVADASKERLK